MHPLSCVSVKFSKTPYACSNGSDLQLFHVPQSSLRPTSESTELVQLSSSREIDQPATHQQRAQRSSGLQVPLHCTHRILSQPFNGLKLAFRHVRHETGTAVASGPNVGRAAISAKGAHNSRTARCDRKPRVSAEPRILPRTFCVVPRSHKPAGGAVRPRS